VRFHRRDCGDTIRNHLNRIEHKLDHALTTLGELMTDQEHLDADVAALTTAVAVIAQEIADLKSQPGAGSLDFTGLDAAVAAVAGLEPPPAA
jgi:archaellum component FlaC